MKILKIFRDVIGFNLNFLSLYNKYLNFWFSKKVHKGPYFDWNSMTLTGLKISCFKGWCNGKYLTFQFPWRWYKALLCSMVFPRQLCLGSRVKFCLKETQKQTSQFWFCLFASLHLYYCTILKLFVGKFWKLSIFSLKIWLSLYIARKPFIILPCSMYFCQFTSCINDLY